MIFTEFMDMVEETHGLETADRILAVAAPASGGAYTAVGNYDPAELLALVGALSNDQNVPVPDLAVAFGRRIFTMFTRQYGHFFREASDAFTFLGGIENYIHVEVRKLYPDAELPTFSYPEKGDTRLVMEYRSTRPLAHFAYGLILATVAHYGDEIQVDMQDLSNGAGTAARFSLARI